MEKTFKIKPVCAALLCALVGILWGGTSHAKPSSIDIAFVLAGGYQPATAPEWQARFPTAEAVSNWQIEQASMIVGGSLGDKNNRRAPILDYIYLQKLNTSPRYLELFLATAAQHVGADFESYFLHYREDTIAKPAKLPPIHGNPLFGAPAIAGYTNNWMHAGFALNHGKSKAADVFARWQDGGALYVYSLDRFDELRFKLASPGRTAANIVIEVPAKRSTDGMVSEWHAVGITEDDTQGLQNDGTIKFSLPNQWPMAATHDGTGQSYGHGQFFAHETLKNKGRYYVARVRWLPKDAAAARPMLQGISLKPRLTVKNGAVYINGFDPANDPNKDGHVDDEEFANRPNKKASARFKYEARVAPLNPPHSGAEGWVYANLMNPNLLKSMKRFFDITLSAQGYIGAYNDEFFLRPSADAIGLVRGGHLLEYPELTPESDRFSAIYNDAFHNAFLVFKGAKGGAKLHVSANINHKSLLDRPADVPFATAFDSVLRENLLTVSTGLISYSGLLMTGDMYALGPKMKTIVQAQTRYGRVQHAGNNQKNWQQDLEALAAQAFLVHQPGTTLFSFWTASFWYGNGLTSDTDFYAAGIPRIAAYYPEAFVNASLGAPVNMVPANRPAASLFVRRDNRFHKIGTSMSGKVTIPIGRKQHSFNNQPTGLYFAHTQGPWDSATNLPSSAVLARRFENGMVLFRTTRHGRDMNFLDAAPVTIALPAPMRRMRPDGTSSEPVSQIELGGYEGAILLNAD